MKRFCQSILFASFVFTFSCRTNSEINTSTKNAELSVCSDPEVIQYLDEFDKILATPSVWQGYVHDDIQLFVQIRNSDKVLVRNMTPTTLNEFGIKTSPCYKNYLLAEIKIKLPENNVFSLINTIKEELLSFYINEGYEELAKMSLKTKKAITTMLIPLDVQSIEEGILNESVSKEEREYAIEYIKNIKSVTAKIFIHESFHAYQQKWQYKHRWSREVINECKSKGDWFAKFQQEISWWKEFISTYRQMNNVQLKEFGLRVLQNRKTNDPDQIKCWQFYAEMEKGEGTAHFVDSLTGRGLVSEKFTIDEGLSYLKFHDNDENSHFYATGSGISVILSNLAPDNAWQSAVEKGSTPIEEMKLLLEK